MSAPANPALVEALRAWARDAGLERESAALERTVTTWVSSIAAPDESPADRLFAAIELMLFFPLDDAAPGEAPALYDAFEAVLRGAPPCAGELPLARAWRDHVARLAERGGAMVRYVPDRLDLVRWYRERARLRAFPAEARFDRFLELRRYTVYVIAWQSLMEARDGEDLLPEEFADPDVQACLRSASDWHSLNNDVASRRRDAAAGETNLVDLLARERGLDAGAACDAVLALGDVELAVFREALPRARQRFPARRVQRYLGALERAIAAGLENYWRLNPERYTSGTPSA